MKIVPRTTCHRGPINSRPVVSLEPRGEPSPPSTRPDSRRSLRKSAIFKSPYRLGRGPEAEECPPARRGNENVLEKNTPRPRNSRQVPRPDPENPVEIGSRRTGGGPSQSRITTRRRGEVLDREEEHHRHPRAILLNVESGGPPGTPPSPYNRPPYGTPAPHPRRAPHARTPNLDAQVHQCDCSGIVTEGAGFKWRRT
ncbi:hypothetical protein GWI33_023193 [Rhynchophorus ferrugineus]|uniref:Uncharacterized protein n=1 Tax=Rhynchophorus ferrugineus TaxID=354439 RepID=A0A834IMK4_RHYFE|nr:hypothetical protein GWI33_023193 [Rhynchophorus ferrugineus]